ncbi:MAG TPA: winged helix-turn-helix transcriptional regulator, partial [Solirubrobacter sp.]|nr:winged helix-turn-helix transcriptional regulator [Solirubrobacter sp.]
MAGYGQFCPIAATAEVLTERWTPLVIRELVNGSRRFNDIQRGVPLMSSSLLTKRLRTLEKVGVIEHRGNEYVLTQAGKELKPLVDQMAVWGERWIRRTIRREDADAAYLMWVIKSAIVTEAAPRGRTTVQFRFTATPKAKRCWWLVLDPPGTDLCLTDPGYDVDLTVRSDPVALASVYMGDIGLSTALRERKITLEGPSHLVRSFPKWFGLSTLIGVREDR